MHSLYIFILQFLYNSACFERQFRSSSGVHDLPYFAVLYTFACICTELQNTVNHELLMMNKMVIQNM